MMRSGSEVGTQSGLFRFLSWGILPLLLVSVVCLIIAAWAAALRASRPWPMTPWESAITVDAWRVTQGLPVCTDPVTGHATHMYGLLTTYLPAPFIRWLGPDVRIARNISFLAVIALSLAAAWLFSRGRGMMTFVLIGALCFLQFYRVGQWETEARPDASSIFMSFVALVMFYRAKRSERLSSTASWTIGGSAAMVVGFFLKQPAIGIALIPFVMELLDRRRPALPRLVLSMVPLMAAAISIALLRVISPWGHFYMVEVPGEYAIGWSRWSYSMMSWVRLNTLFLVAVFAWIATTRQGAACDPVDVWILAAALITAPMCAAAHAKFGGQINSFLPTFIAIAIFIGRALPEFFATRTLQISPIGTAILALLMPLPLLADIAAPTRQLSVQERVVEQGDKYYKDVIRIVRKLPGKVVCPDDPTIPLRANNYAGRSGDCELDANCRDLPRYATAELLDAEWVVQITGPRKPILSPSWLKHAGFAPEHWEIPSDSVYVLYKRVPPKPKAAKKRQK